MVWPNKDIDYPKPIHPPYKFVAPAALHQLDEHEAYTTRFPPGFEPEILPTRLTGLDFVEWSTQSHDGTSTYMMNILTPYGWEMPQKLLDDFELGVPNELVYQVHSAGLLIQKTPQLFETINRRYEAAFVSDGWPEHSTMTSKLGIMPGSVTQEVVQGEGRPFKRRAAVEPPRGQFSRPNSVSQPISKRVSRSVSGQISLPRPQPTSQAASQPASKAPFKSVWTKMRPPGNANPSQTSDSMAKTSNLPQNPDLEKLHRESLLDIPSDPICENMASEAALQHQLDLPTTISNTVAELSTEIDAAKAPRTTSSRAVTYLDEKPRLQREIQPKPLPPLESPNIPEIPRGKDTAKPPKTDSSGAITAHTTEKPHVLRELRPKALLPPNRPTTMLKSKRAPKAPLPRTTLKSKGAPDVTPPIPGLKSKLTPDASAFKRMRIEHQNLGSDFSEETKLVELQLRPSGSEKLSHVYSLHASFLNECRLWRLKTTRLEPQFLTGADGGQIDRYFEWYNNTFATLYRWMENFEKMELGVLEELRQRMSKGVEIVDADEMSSDEDQRDREGTRGKRKGKAVVEKKKVLYRIIGGRVVAVNEPFRGNEALLRRGRAVSLPMPVQKADRPVLPLIPKETPSKWWAQKIERKERDPTRPWTDWT